VPVGLAASLAAGALLVGVPASTDSAAGPADTVSVSGVVLGAATGTGGEVADQLVARASDDWLLLQIMSR